MTLKYFFSTVTVDELVAAVVSASVSGVYGPVTTSTPKLVRVEVIAVSVRL